MHFPRHRDLQTTAFLDVICCINWLTSSFSGIGTLQAYYYFRQYRRRDSRTIKLTVRTMLHWERRGRHLLLWRIYAPADFNGVMPPRFYQRGPSFRQPDSIFNAKVDVFHFSGSLTLYTPFSYAKGFGITLYSTGGTSASWITLHGMDGFLQIHESLPWHNHYPSGPLE